ncbi:MAG: hypothetical protein EOP58_10260 [Sphingomonadales bacterium]|nr:MAG: hypothetical protein EOP58_10260 [Sphingomonadales bacterium]
MATLHAGAAPRTAEQAERRFYMIMAIAMALVIVAGFSLNLATGRSNFAVPPIYHAHAVVFMGWLALWVAQAVTIATGRRALHIRLGKLGYLWIPLMVVMGITIMIAVARRTGGPFFFAVNEFLVSNIAGVLVFGALAMWSLRIRRHDGWHRRLMFSAMVVLVGPGIGRLLPMPLLIPNAWTISFAVTLIFPAIAMVADLRRCGRVHAALWWGTGINIGVFVASLLLAHSALGLAFTQAVIAGTPGAERPMQPFLPPGFAM